MRSFYPLNTFLLNTSIWPLPWLARRHKNLPWIHINLSRHYRRCLTSITLYSFEVNNYIPQNERLQFSSLHPFTPTFIETHISKSKNLDPNALYENRVKGRTILLENPTRDSRTKKKEEERKKQRQKDAERKKQKLISKKEAKLKGLWSLEKTQKRCVLILNVFKTSKSIVKGRYELFVPLHHLWLGYMSELLGLGQIPTPIPDKPPLPNSGALHTKLVKADFHGSIMTGAWNIQTSAYADCLIKPLLSVKKAKNPCLVGISGIVLLETENAFRIINIKNQVKCNVFSWHLLLDLGLTMQQ